MRGFQKGPLEVPEKFRVWVGGLLDFKVYLSPLLGEGVLSMIERTSKDIHDFKINVEPLRNFANLMSLPTNICPSILYRSFLYLVYKD